MRAEEVGSPVKASFWEGRGAWERLDSGAGGGDCERRGGGEDLRWLRRRLECLRSSRESERLLFSGGGLEMLRSRFACLRSSRWLLGRRSGDSLFEEYFLLTLGRSFRGLRERCLLL